METTPKLTSLSNTQITTVLTFISNDFPSGPVTSLLKAPWMTKRFFTAHYKLTSTSMLWLQTNRVGSGTMNLGGSLTRQVEQVKTIFDGY